MTNFIKKAGVAGVAAAVLAVGSAAHAASIKGNEITLRIGSGCLLYTSDAADD